MQSINTLKDLFTNSQRIVFLTGAGISTDSGIPDFRSSQGLYNTITTPLIFSKWAFRLLPWYFYRKMGPMYAGIKYALPNRAHKAIARLEDMDKDVTVITQNVDGLHQKAGSSHVLEVHGTLDTLTCRRCGWKTSVTANEDAIMLGHTPHCRVCGGVLKPDLVFFGDYLPDDVMAEAQDAVENADLLVVAGTSLEVGTVPSLLECRNITTPIVIINRDPTDWDTSASAVYHDSIGDTLVSALA